MKYIVYKPEWESTARLYDDLDLCADVISYQKFQRNIFWEKIFKAHCIGRLSFLPCKKIWRRLCILNDLPQNEQYIFVFMGGMNVTFAVETGLIDHLRKRYKDSRYVAYYTDIHYARSHITKITRQEFDKIYIFDASEASKMGIDYYPISFSKGFFCDVSYVGQDKGRLEEIVKIYDHLNSSGVNCSFYLSEVPKEKQILRKGIKYGKMMDYDTSLQYIVNSNCVLELRVGDVTSYSDRVQKAIAYNKKILTNNPSIKNNPFYTPDMVQIYTDVDKIDPCFVKASVNKVSYNYNDEFSPIHFLNEIKTELFVLLEDDKN